MNADERGKVVLRHAEVTRQIIGVFFHRRLVFSNHHKQPTRLRSH